MVRAEARLIGEPGIHFALSQIPIPAGFCDLKHLTIDVSTSALETAAFSWIKALMRLHLDQLTIRLSGTVEDAREAMDIGKSRRTFLSAFMTRDLDTASLYHAALTLQRVVSEIDKSTYMFHEGNKRLPS
jgi:hypothetical protein